MLQVFSVKFLSIFVDVSGSIEPVILIWLSLGRSLPAELEYRLCQSSCQKSNEGQLSSLLVTGQRGYGHGKKEKIVEKFIESNAIFNCHFIISKKLIFNNSMYWFCGFTASYDWSIE